MIATITNNSASTRAFPIPGGGQSVKPGETVEGINLRDGWLDDDRKASLEAVGVTIEVAPEPEFDRAAMQARAEELNLIVDGRWSDSRLADKIAEAEAAQAPTEGED